MTYQTYLKNRKSYLEDVEIEEVEKAINDAIYEVASASKDANFIVSVERVLSNKRNYFENRTLSREQIIIYEAHHSWSCMTKSVYRF